MATVLVVDDMALYRVAIARFIGETPGLSVLGQCDSGQLALDAIRTLKPDVVTLDLEMPNMSGIEVLQHLRHDGWRGDHPKIIVFSAQGRAAALATMGALSAGAVDFVQKPNSTQGADGIKNVLIPRILALTDKPTSTSIPPARTNNTPQIDYRKPRAILAIASSTGGPSALKLALAKFPKDFPAPIVISQHMPPIFTATMAENLDSDIALKVVEARHGMTLERGCVYIAPGDYHMAVAEGISGASITLNQSPAVSGLRPAADIMFDSLIRAHGSRTVAAVFTGMGQDGAMGCKKLADAGAAVITQSKESCVVYSMPKAVDEMGLSGAHFSPENF
jgi:two-component system, chemotaxis family, protein-glutamate methylesterase/glutaminase